MRIAFKRLVAALLPLRACSCSPRWLRLPTPNMTPVGTDIIIPTIPIALPMSGAIGIKPRLIIPDGGVSLSGMAITSRIPIGLAIGAITTMTTNRAYPSRIASARV